MFKAFRKPRRSNGSVLVKVALAIVGFNVVRHLYPEFRRYVKLHEM